MVTKQFGQWEEDIQSHFFDKSWHNSPYDIIVFQNEPCGFCCIKETEHIVQLMEFAVDSAKQGQGIGSMLLEEFKAMAKRKNKTAQLNVMKTNERARALYQRLGFSIYGENQFQFLMRHGDDCA
jgi:ribosomal protein S18 acetylase RimI-like enzyme